MTTLPQRPDNVQAVGLNAQGLQLRTTDGTYPVVDRQGLHLQASDFNGLELPCLPLVDELGQVHYLSVESSGTLLLDGEIVGGIEKEENEIPTD